MDLGPYRRSGTVTDAPGPVDTPLFSEGSLKRKTSPRLIAEFLFFKKQNSVPISWHFLFFFLSSFKELKIDPRFPHHPHPQAELHKVLQKAAYLLLQSRHGEG